MSTRFYLFVFLPVVLGPLMMAALVRTSVVLLFTVSSVFGQERVDGAGENAEVQVQARQGMAARPTRQRKASISLYDFGFCFKELLFIQGARTRRTVRSRQDLPGRRREGCFFLGKLSLFGNEEVEEEYIPDV
jgi:hypothetical protein